MPKSKAHLGTQFKRFSGRVYQQKRLRKQNNIVSHGPRVPIAVPHVTSAVPTISQEISQIGCRVSHIETPVFESTCVTIAVTPDSPTSPPVIKFLDSNDLFDSISVWSDFNETNPHPTSTAAKPLSSFIKKRTLMLKRKKKKLKKSKKLKLDFA
eukprot:scaffold271586_cov52-Attheya_sp.AAC.2